MDARDFNPAGVVQVCLHFVSRVRVYLYFVWIGDMGLSLLIMITATVVTFGERDWLERMIDKP